MPPSAAAGHLNSPILAYRTSSLVWAGDSSYQWEFPVPHAENRKDIVRSSECADSDSFPGCAGFTVCPDSLPILSRIGTIAFDKSSNLKEKLAASP